jgi:ABC-type glycerol-3-phosphate transport system permease component
MKTKIEPGRSLVVNILVTLLIGVFDYTMMIPSQVTLIPKFTIFAGQRFFVKGLVAGAVKG